MTGLIELLAATLTLVPAVGVVALSVPALIAGEPTERSVCRQVRIATTLNFLVALALAIACAATGGHVITLGQWYGDASYALDLTLAVDPVSAGAALVIAVVAMIVSRFSEAYLHRDTGHLRFFAVILLSVSCLNIVALAGSLDVLFVGWELLGLCSFLLIAYFHERQRAVDHALRAIFTYRLADLGLLLCLIIMHGEHGSAGLGPAAVGVGALAGPVGLLLLVTAAGKAGLGPVSGWLGRSMEGPTPSTAMFYAGLSVHAGPYMLLRAWPLYESSDLARGCLVAFGLGSAVLATLQAQARGDAKGAIVLGGSAQIGLIVAEIGLGLHTLALLHLVGNLGLRVWQMLRAPSALALRRSEESLLGRAVGPAWNLPGWAWLWLSPGVVPSVLELGGRALMRVSHDVDRLSRWVEARAVGGRDEVDP